MMPVNKNIKIFLNYYLGPVLFIWLAFTIYHQVKNQPHLESSWYRIKHVLQGEQSWKIWVVLLLMFVNWGVEARKWQVLLKPVERMSLWNAFKATLAGVAFSINTPNRIGEYGGRILYVKEGNRIKAISLTIVGSISQFIITIVLGCIGLVFLMKTVDPATLPGRAGSYLFWIEVMVSMLTIACIGILLFYFRLYWVVMLIEKVPAFSKFARHIAVLEDLNTGILVRVLSLSLTRYLVFVFQYILMLQLMEVNLTVWQAFWLICVVFLVMALVPTIALAEIGIRGKVSLELFGLFSTNHIGIVAASAGIWGINLVLPALLGCFLILRIKIFSNNETNTV